MSKPKLTQPFIEYEGETWILLDFYKHEGKVLPDTLKLRRLTPEERRRLATIKNDFTQEGFAFVAPMVRKRLGYKHPYRA